ncbi:MAG: deoxyribose-phosphate aldolase [Acidimicrobiales bacterium]
MTLTKTQFVAMVDHTLLAADATEADVSATVADAMQLRAAAVCINGCWVAHARSLVGDQPVAVCSVIGFPLGAGTSEAKAAEAPDAVANGASEIDMVVNLGLLRDRAQEQVVADIAAVRARLSGDVTLKVILETAILSDEEIVAGCQAAETAGADFVKTSTGFHAAGGASTHAVELMAHTVDGRLGVKASGGIRTLADVVSVVDAGATRLGMSATLAVAAELGT